MEDKEGEVVRRKWPHRAGKKKTNSKNELQRKTHSAEQTVSFLCGKAEQHFHVWPASACVGGENGGLGVVGRTKPPG